uniref:Molybdopterin synthase sulfur carrier subunit n=1 Tax=Parastrongyloides trichosuri TaxID=131310 RepID=A0A0N5A2I5_PARTI
MIEKEVLLFGPVAEEYNSRSVKISFPLKSNGNDIMDIVFQNVLKNKELRYRCMLAVNQEYIDDLNDIIDMNTVNEIAIIPPLSGG